MRSAITRYPLSLRVLHWARAGIIVGMIGAGWLMTRLGDAIPAKYELLYPYHKSFGLLVLALVVVQIAIRVGATLPPPARGIAGWERRLSKLVHVAMYLLLVSVPLMGYAMSSSYSHSDGVTFFGIPVPELLPKNDDHFAVFRLLHRVMAYALLALIALHVAGVAKHRFLDRRPDSNVLPRML